MTSKINMTPLLKVRNVSAVYDELIALDNVNVDVGDGDIVAVIGANAAGKSTLISTISGLVPNSTGEILFQDQRIDQLPVHKRVELGVVHVPEGRKLFSDLTVQDNLELGAFNPRARGDLRSKLEQVFEIFPKLRERRQQLCGSLSGGERQMCAIGRGLMGKPVLLVLDEPTLGLSPVMSDEVLATIQEINKQGVTVLLVEQNAFHSLELSNRAYVIENGRVVMDGVSQHLLQSEELKRAYLGL